jgi:Ca2+-binding RTX toxin-like protein
VEPFASLAYFQGRNSDEILVGTQFDDTFNGLGGDDVLEGGAGRDLAFYNGPRSNYSIAATPDGGWIVQDDVGPDGGDNVYDVERLQFTDINVAFDIDGNAGEAYRLYQAAFNRVPDVGGLGYHMYGLDIGLPLTHIAQHFIESPEFDTTYGDLSNTEFVEQLYWNVLFRAPDQAGLDYHLNRLDRGATWADILVGFSESPENQLNVIGAIQNGMEYLP